jgi:hypothetical protein
MDRILPFLAAFLLAGIVAAIGVVIVNKARKFWQILGLLVILGACVSPYVFWWVAPMIYQDGRLRQFYRAFNQYLHPTDTTLVDSFQGMPHYASNYCAYFVGELRTYSGGKQEVIDFYSNQDTPSFIDGGNIYIVFVDDQNFSAAIPVYEDHWRHYSQDAQAEAIEWSWDLSPSALSEKPHYIVYFTYIGDYYFDYRCH